MDRDAELRIKGHLFEIEEYNDEFIGHQQGYPISERAYKKTLESAAECATEAPKSMKNSEVKMVIDQVADYIKEYIEDYEDRPENRKVRRKARKIVSQAGYPPDSYLNAA